MEAYSLSVAAHLRPPISMILTTSVHLLAPLGLVGIVV
jgi:hypothetical protein